MTQCSPTWAPQQEPESQEIALQQPSPPVKQSNQGDEVNLLKTYSWKIEIRWEKKSVDLLQRALNSNIRGKEQKEQKDLENISSLLSSLSFWESSPPGLQGRTNKIRCVQIITVMLLPVIILLPMYMAVLLWLLNRLPLLLLENRNQLTSLPLPQG